MAKCNECGHKESSHLFNNDEEGSSGAKVYCKTCHREGEVTAPSHHEYYPEKMHGVAKEVNRL